MTVHLSRRRFVTVGGLALLAGLPVTAFAVRPQVRRVAADRPNNTSVTSDRKTAAVQRRDMTRTVDASGSLTYGDPRPIKGVGAGTVTGLPAPGDLIGPNQPLYWVDNHPGPIVMSGKLPMWRDLGPGVADGDDVHQLEANLAYMGFADTDMTVDNTYTSAATRAVKRWQKSHGVAETGKVDHGDVWFADQPLRVSDVKALIGDPADGEIISVTGEQRRIRVDLDAKQVRYVHVGDHVGLELPDGTKSTGTITSIADTATVTKGADGTDTTTVKIEISPESAFDALDGSPVTVTITTSTTAGVLAVPVETIVATTDHRYALEVVDTDGTTHLTEIKLGQSADGWVEITGDIAEGTKVVSA